MALESNGKAEKRKWTEAERLELAAKLDKDLDEYIQSLESKPYEDGWPEDRWQEEMEKHPFFMKQLPKPGEELSPLMEGLQQLKYGEDENTPEELAANYKEDGNYNYKYKNYRLAIVSYTEGIKRKCSDVALVAQLYNNRAAAHLMLKNYRSSLRDSEKAVALDPKYQKARTRAAVCCFHTGDYERCIDLCEKYLQDFPNDKEINSLKKRAIVERKKQERDGRMRDAVVKKTEREEDRLLQTIKETKICVELDDGSRTINGEYQLKDFEPRIPQLAEHRVKLDKTGRLIWPVMILYPETLLSDFIQNFHQDTPFMDQLEDLFVEPPEWDVEQRYVLPNLSVYFEGPNKNSIHKVDVSRTLGSILQHEKFVLRGGVPCFLVVIASSDYERIILNKYQKGN